MKEATKELLKEFEREHEISVSATDAQMYWVLYARIQAKQEDRPRHLHHGIKYVSGPGQDGSVLVLRDPFISDAYSVETWGQMETIDDFVTKGLARILEEEAAGGSGSAGECGTSCS